ncbi:MAG: hypothetical protein HRT89_15945, partial [Lentisphaeria bacterium]|nr:hypothetical protein [Lentisphaeria bacterium]
MIVCPKCKADNQIGAIFCRGCGEKLNLDELDPADMQAQAKKFNKQNERSNFNLFGMIRNVIGIAILAFLLFIIMRLFATPDFAYVDDLSDKDSEIMDEQSERFKHPEKRGSGKKYTIAEITYLARTELMLNEEGKEAEAAKQDVTDYSGGGGHLRAESIWFDVITPDDGVPGKNNDNSTNEIRITIKFQHTTMGFISMYRVVTGRVFYNNDRNMLDFEIFKVKNGKFSIPQGSWADPVRNAIRESLNQVVVGKANVTQLRQSIKVVHVYEDGIYLAEFIRGKRPKRKKRK